MKYILLLLVPLLGLCAVQPWDGSTQSPPVLVLSDGTRLHYQTNDHSIRFLGRESVLATNWVDMGATRTLMFPESANTTTHHQHGTVVSNVIVTIRLDGVDHKITMSSVPIDWLNRAYTRRIVRRYSDGTEEVESTL